MTAALANNSYVNQALTSYHAAKGQDANGVGDKIKKFGDVWVGVRFEFLKSAASTTVDTVYSVATAVFNTLWALTAGVLFTNQDLRDKAITSIGSVVGNVGNVAKSVVGLACPYLVDRLFHGHVEVASKAQ